MRSEGQVERVLERMRHLGFLKNLLAELDEGIHRHNRRAATHGLQPVQGAKLFARIPGHSRAGGHARGRRQHRAVNGVAGSMPTWYVTDPRTGRVKHVEADAESTARWTAWSLWYGDRPRTDDEDRHYEAVEVIPT